MKVPSTAPGLWWAFSFQGSTMRRRPACLRKSVISGRHRQSIAVTVRLMGTNEAEYVQQGIDEAETYKATAYDYAQECIETARILAQPVIPELPAMADGSIFGSAVARVNERTRAIIAAEQGLKDYLLDEAQRLGVEPPHDLMGPRSEDPLDS